MAPPATAETSTSIGCGAANEFSLSNYTVPVYPVRLAATFATAVGVVQIDCIAILRSRFSIQFEERFLLEDTTCLRFQHHVFAKFLIVLLKLTHFTGPPNASSTPTV